MSISSSLLSQITKRMKKWAKPGIYPAALMKRDIRHARRDIERTREKYKVRPSSSSSNKAIVIQDILRRLMLLISPKLANRIKQKRTALPIEGKNLLVFKIKTWLASLLFSFGALNADFGFNSVKSDQRNLNPTRLRISARSRKSSLSTGSPSPLRSGALQRVPSNSSIYMNIDQLPPSPVRNKRKASDDETQNKRQRISPEPEPLMHTMKKQSFDETRRSASKGSSLLIPPGDIPEFVPRPSPIVLVNGVSFLFIL